VSQPGDGAALHTMGAVRRLTGLTDRQIRYYHRHGLVAPRRSPGGHRLFAAADVERLLQVRRLLAAGLSVAEIRTRLGAPRPPQRARAAQRAPRPTQVRKAGTS
jgi:DNA-binding transcriptional MerR regulator